MERTFALHTIGCKLNQFDSERIREALVRARWEYRPFEEGAQFCIINSCTVTGRSDARCRNAVRRARSRRSDAVIIVTGCYAETQPEAVASVAEVDLVLGNAGKGALPAILEEIASEGRPASPLAPLAALDADDAAEVPIDCFLDHSRAFVKVQEGCDAACSYCIVPRARGSSRSVPERAVLEQAATLEAAGYHEIVLCGIHLGRYGAELDPPSTLADLVETLVESTKDVRFRLSSLEVTEVSPRLVDLMRGTERIAPHLHVPLQSGDDAVLAAMNRPYDAAAFAARIDDVARSVEGVGLGTDIIVGFPGEDEAAFGRTVRLVRELPFSYLHVFGYSPRPLTPAAAMTHQVHGAEKRRRSSLLIALGRRKRLAFMRAQVGSTQRALIQSPPGPRSTYARALTGNYSEVLVKAGASAIGGLSSVRITKSARGMLYGSIVESLGTPPEAPREAPA